MIPKSSNKEQYEKARKMFTRVNAKIRKLTHHMAKTIDFSQAGYNEVAAGSIDGEPVERVIIILKGFGCEWAQEKEGGCTMCGHLSGSSHGTKIADDDIKKQFDDAMAEYDFHKYPLLCVYNGGSWLNETELSRDLRHYMYNKIASTPGIRRVIIESRVDYINAEMLDEMEEMMPNITVEIGVGVETVNDELRDLVLNKGVISEDLKRAGKLFKNRRTKMLAYILVNPPFLTETEAIADTVSSIKFAHELGASIVSLEAVSIQHFTAVSFLAEAGYYQTPWIWSIFEIVKQVYHLGIQIRIGGFEFFPIPKEYTSNCPSCDADMVERIHEFNRHNDLLVISNPICESHCDRRWKERLVTRDNRPLEERIIETLNKIDTDSTLQKLASHAQ